MSHMNMVASILMRLALWFPLSIIMRPETLGRGVIRRGFTVELICS